MKAAVLLAALLAGGPLAAQQTCASTAYAPGFAPGQAPLAERLAIGQPVALSLRPAETVTYAPPPARRPEPGSYGGVFPLEVTAAGTYQFALSGRAWIDVARDGAALEEAGHQHGDPCSGIAKTVAFRLEPGRYAIQLSAAPARGIVVRVLRQATIPGTP